MQAVHLLNEQYADRQRQCGARLIELIADRQHQAHSCERRWLLAGEGVFQYDRAADLQDVDGVRDDYFDNGADSYAWIVYCDLIG
jgi:hypothetical protein